MEVVTRDQLPSARLATLDSQCRSTFQSLFPFAERDLNVQSHRVELSHLLTLGDDAWHVCLVYRGSSLSLDAPKLQRFPKMMLAVEGPAGVGKTTILDKYNCAGGDMADLRRGIYNVLVQGTQAMSYFWLALRMFETRGPVIDRSDWLASTVYGAYNSRYLYLMADEPIKQLMVQAPPYRIVILDDEELSDEEIHERVQRRDGIDAATPLSYTTVTRELFRLCARHYGFDYVSPSELDQLIQSMLKSDTIDGPTELSYCRNACRAPPTSESSGFESPM